MDKFANAFQRQQSEMVNAGKCADVSENLAPRLTSRTPCQSLEELQRLEDLDEARRISASGAYLAFSVGVASGSFWTLLLVSLF
ncbi:MAG: hypothetical protein OEU92_01815 [Alphaproteobacteria bacterium]|nr:hypothetical protein [Alphaproteobacteria bacterium]